MTEPQKLRFARLEAASAIAEERGYVVSDTGDEYPLVCRFNSQAAVRVERFFRKVLRHTQGDKAGHPFVLTGWQKKNVIYPLFGWQRWDWDRGIWVRQYATCYITMGRGNGKTELLSGVALYLMTADGEPRAQVYGAAEDKEQASIAWEGSLHMVKASPVLSRRVKPTESKLQLADPRTGSYYRVLGGMDQLGNLGKNPHGIIVDELVAIAANNSGMIEALEGALGKRRQAMMVMATTAGPMVDGLAYDEHQHALKVEKDPMVDPTRLVFVRCAVEGDDPFDPATWKMSNPALGDFLARQTLVDMANRARYDPIKLLEFKVWRLNIWSQPTTDFIPLHAWDACPSEPLDEEDLVNESAWGGVDLSGTSDLTVICWVFGLEDGTVAMLWRVFVPEAKVQQLVKVTGGAFQVWIDDGWVVVCPGEMIDYDMVHERLDDDSDLWYVEEVGIDRFNAAQTFHWCQGRGIPAVSVTQGVPLSGALKELARLAHDGKLRHGGNPVARWCLAGAVLKMDAKEQVQLVRPKRGGRSRHRVDPLVAAAMGLNRMANAPDEAAAARIPLR